jgi:uncharacterized protein (TIGR03000 family)
MKKVILGLGLIALLLAVFSGAVFAFRGGGFGGFHAGGFGGFRGGDFGGFHEGGWSGSRSVSGWSGDGRWGGTSSYDRSYSGRFGGSYDASGTRGAVAGPYGAAAGGTRDVTATGPGGRTYSGSTTRGAAVGPGGAVAGGSRTGFASGPGGTAAGASHWGAAATRFPTDGGFAHYSGAAVGTWTHPTTYWSGGYMAGRAGYVRSGFYGYGAFHPAWYTSHPGAWATAGWVAGAAWAVATVPALTTFCAIPAPPIYFDYGNTIVYQNNAVYDNGTDLGTAQQYEQQAAAIAQQGQQTQPPPTDKWQPLGVFALVQGEEKTSNTMFQLAINAEGILRGNYYDGLMDSTTPIYGSVDKKSQRAAWIIGDKKTPLFEAGLFNLTRDETPVLVHFGPDKTQQWLLVRMQQPSGQAAAPPQAPASAPPAAPAPAHVTVIVPADAQVFFDGVAMNETGTQRVFATPELQPGQQYFYDIEAQWSANGQVVDQTRKVTVSAGGKFTVDFTAAQP